MSNNDEVVFGIPSITCPSCGETFDLADRNHWYNKYTKAQRKSIVDKKKSEASKPVTVKNDPFPNREDNPPDDPERNYIVISCGNIYCDQYNKFKVFKVPRIHTPSVKVDLND